MIHHSQQHQLAGYSQKLILLLRTTAVGHSCKQGQVPPSVDVCFWVLPGDVLENTDIYHFDLPKNEAPKQHYWRPQNLSHKLCRKLGAASDHPWPQTRGPFQTLRNCTAPGVPTFTSAGGQDHLGTAKATGLVVLPRSHEDH